jgi:hypothetical protein
MMIQESVASPQAFSTALNGVIYHGTYTVKDGKITVSSSFGTRTKPVRSAKIAWLARYLLRQMVVRQGALQIGQ